MQFYYNKTLWGLPQLPMFSILISNFLLLISNFLLFRLTIRNKYSSTSRLKYLIEILKGRKLKEHSRLSKKPLKLIVLTFISCFLWIYVYGFLSLDQFLYRISGDRSSNIQLTGTASLLFETVRYVPFFAFIIYRVNYKTNVYLNILFLIIILYLFPPMAISRFNLGVIYLTLLIVLFPSILKGFRMHLLLFFGFFTAFPISDFFRYKSGAVKNSFFDSSPLLNLNYLLTESFDTYNSFVTVVDQNIITYGYQLLGVIFFFIPRVIWLEKPVGSGTYVSELNNLEFGNISLNYYGEAFINFGYLGVLLFTLILGLVIRRMELLDLKVLISRRKLNIFIIIYLIMIPYIFFILRGDLLSSVSYLASMCIAILITVVTEARFTPKRSLK